MPSDVTKFDIPFLRSRSYASLVLKMTNLWSVVLFLKGLEEIFGVFPKIFNLLMAFNVFRRKIKTARNLSMFV